MKSRYNIFTCVFCLIMLIVNYASYSQGIATGVISYTATIDVVENDSEINHSWEAPFSNKEYFLFVRAWITEDMNGKLVQVENSIYDFDKTENGFSLKLKNPGGKLTYYAVESAISSTSYTQSFIATEGQSRFTLDNFSSEAWVWLNGLLQFPDDWSTEGNDIVLATPINAGDQLRVYYKEGLDNQTGTDPTNYTISLIEKYLHDASPTNSGTIQKESMPYPDGTTVILENDFPNSGANFQGYSIIVDGANPSTSLSINVNQDITVYAVYDYTIPDPSTLLNGMVACWEFEESVGATLVDSTSNNLNGVISGALPDANGQLGNCYSFDGINDRVQIDNNELLSLDDDLTISLWAYPTDISKGRQTLLCKHYHYEYEVVMETDGGISFYHGDGFFEDMNEPDGMVVSENTWNHICITRVRSTRSLRFYINGIFVGEDIFGEIPIANTDRVYLGSRLGTGLYYKGLIDQTIIYSRALTSEEITELYNNGNGKAYPFNQ